MSAPRIEALYIARRPAAPMEAVEHALLIAGAGVEGDRYALGQGTFSKNPGGGRHITLFEHEVLDQVRREYGLELAPRETRRNVITKDAALNHLVEREFRIGEVILKGIRPCEPCAHLDGLLDKRGVIKPLVHRGGLRAEIVRGGVIRPGDLLVY